MDDRDRFERAIAAIDAANADDPQVIRVRGEDRPKELAHADLVSEWVTALTSDDAAGGPSEALLLAARAHHIRRWSIARDTHPAGRAGYHRWRKALHAFHAEEVGRILADVGYEEATSRRVKDLVEKRGLGRDPEVQVLEDALCLVFVETQLADLAARLEADKLLDVAKKTLEKMSPAAIALAVELPLEPAHLELLLEASATAG